MSFAVRNSLALGIILFLILAVGIYFRVFSYPKTLKKIDADIKSIEKELENTADLLNKLNTTKANLEVMEKRWNNRNKDIPTIDITSQTYAYLNRVIDLSGFVKVNMVYNGEKRFANYGYNIYNLRGEATFENLYKFIWYLENGRRLYKIESISLKGQQVREKLEEPTQTLIQYEMTLQAYFTSEAKLASSTGWRDTSTTFLTFNPFKPIISSEIPPNDRGLVEVERSELKAVVAGKAFVLDQKGVIRTLMEGDEVYLGYVTKINPEQNKVEFTLNKAGLVEKVELKMRFEAAEGEVKK